MNKIIAFDFDSTVVTKESLDEVITLALQTDPDRQAKIQQVEDITNQGMNGQIDFCEAVTARLSICSLKRHHFVTVGTELTNHITPGFSGLIDWLQQTGWKVYLVSGGFRPCLLPVAEILGIHENQVFCQDVLFDDQDHMIGIDTNNLLFTNEGKGPVMDHIRGLELTEKIILIGDGANDLRAFETGKVDGFIGFGGNVIREKVKEKSTFFTMDCDEIKSVLTRFFSK